MVEGLIGKKVGMTQTFDEKGNVIPVTVFEAGPCAVVQMKTRDKDGYSAVQLALIEEKKNKKNKPLAGHLKKANIPGVKLIREFRFLEGTEIKEGTRMLAELVAEGERLHVTATRKGKGCAGVVKRWGFHGGKKTHGSMFHRRPGSTGAWAYPSRVIKGKKLPGHMGTDRVLVKNLKVVQVEKDSNLLVLKGSVPGAKGGYVLIKKAGFHPEVSQEAKKE